MTPTVPGAFEPLVYVYDVGASPKVALLDSAIDRFVALLLAEKISRVQFVIVSHIDTDHVNRLYQLLDLLKSNGIHVERLMLPWLDPISKLAALVRTPGNAPSAVVEELLQQPGVVSARASAHGVEEVVFVLPETDEDAEPDAPSDSGAYVPSGSVPLPPNTAPWTLVVTHLKAPKKTLSEFRRLVLQNTGLDPSLPTNHRTLLDNTRRPGAKTNRRIVQDAMDTAARRTGLTPGKATITNWSSMTLFGASANPFAAHAVPALPTPSSNTADDFEWDCGHGWLHTGDLPVDDPSAWSAVTKGWARGFGTPELCALVAPHHGSTHTHSPALYTRFKPRAVLFTFGLTSASRRGHPKYAKLIDPLPAQRYVRSSTSAKVRPLNNRP